MVKECPQSNSNAASPRKSRAIESPITVLNFGEEWSLSGKNGAFLRGMEGKSST